VPEARERRQAGSGDIPQVRPLADLEADLEATPPRCDVSVVVPALNEAESLPDLIASLTQVLADAGQDFEIVIVDDGSTDDTYEVLTKLAVSHPQLHTISFNRNYGKAAALAAGFKAAGGKFVVTIDADLQDDPAEIPELLAKLVEGYDLVSGWKQNRKDSFIKNQTSRLFNSVTSLVTGLRLHDFNCGLKAYRNEVTRAIRLYGEMHRYIPALAHLEGYRVTEIPVRHHARRYGKTKYGTARFLNGFFDLMTLVFLQARSTSPLHLFGRIGFLFFIVGLVINGYFLAQWILGHGLRVRPLMVAGLVAIMLAIQFVSLGLIAELIVAGRHPETEYRVRRRF
jgi:glycosyltransferase involved in cell wall biosynthesis